METDETEAKKTSKEKQMQTDADRCSVNERMV